MAKKDKFTAEDDELLAALGVEVEVKKKVTFTALEERVFAGFEEIQKFVDGLSEQRITWGLEFAMGYAF